MSTLVTAVVTTCARPKHVAEALASVRAETYEHIECVVVDDDGGFDRTLAHQMRVIPGEGRGIGHSRNAGLAAARGEFVIFLDDDDVALPNRITTLIAAAAQHRADACFGMTRRTGGASVVPTHTVPGPIGFSDVLTCAPHVNAVLARTAALRAVGGFDTTTPHFDDWSAWLRLADRKASMYCVPDVVAEWRIHDRGLSGAVFQLRAMKARILGLFDRLVMDLSEENARVVAMARRAVAAADPVTYDDYANAMAALREMNRTAPGSAVDLKEILAG